MATITNTDPPKIPYGFDEKFINYTTVNLPVNQVLAHVTTSARPEADFERAGINISTNRGQPIAAGLSEYIYFGDIADWRDATGGSKHKDQYTRDDVFRVVANITARYGGKLILACDEAQENEGYWQYHDDLTPQQNEWYHQAWKEYGDAHPEFLGFYSVYSGSTTPVIFKGVNAIREALKSPEAAYNFLKTTEFYKCHYWTREWWKYRGPLINMYIHQMSSKHLVMAELVITIRLHQLALQFVGRDPHDMLVFFWTDTASGLLGSYTERHIRPIKGGTGFAHTFPGWCAESMVQISRYAFEHGRHGFNWLDTYLNGTNTAIVPQKFVRDYDNFVLSDCDSTEVSRVSYHNPSPYRPQSTTYPCTLLPHGGQDMGPLGAWWKCQNRAVVNLELQPIEWSQNGEPFIDVSPWVYWIRTWVEKLAWVEGAVLGDTAVITIYDLRGRYCVKGRGTMNVRINGKVYPVNYIQGVHNQITIKL
jgi:hypothetical protein